MSAGQHNKVLPACHFSWFTEQRMVGLMQIADAKAAGKNPYPHKFHVSMLLPDYIAKYSGIQEGEQLKEEKVSVAGDATWIMHTDA